MHLTTGSKEHGAACDRRRAIGVARQVQIVFQAPVGVGRRPVQYLKRGRLITLKIRAISNNVPALNYLISKIGRALNASNEHSTRLWDRFEK